MIEWFRGEQGRSSALVAFGWFFSMVDAPYVVRSQTIGLFVAASNHVLPWRVGLGLAFSCVRRSLVLSCAKLYQSTPDSHEQVGIMRQKTG